MLSSFCVSVHCSMLAVLFQPFFVIQWHLFVKVECGIWRALLCSVVMWCSANLSQIVLSLSIPREDGVVIRERLCLLLD